MRYMNSWFNLMQSMPKNSPACLYNQLATFHVMRLWVHHLRGRTQFIRFLLFYPPFVSSSIHEYSLFRVVESLATNLHHKHNFPELHFSPLRGYFRHWFTCAANCSWRLLSQSSMVPEPRLLTTIWAREWYLGVNRLKEWCSVKIFNNIHLNLITGASSLKSLSLPHTHSSTLKTAAPKISF